MNEKESERNSVGISVGSMKSDQTLPRSRWEWATESEPTSTKVESRAMAAGTVGVVVTNKTPGHKPSSCKMAQKLNLQLLRSQK